MIYLSFLLYIEECQGSRLCKEGVRVGTNRA
jgi:hypothetical protein